MSSAVQQVPRWVVEMVSLFASDPGVEAMTITGSRAGGAGDKDSDWDLFAYVRGDVMPTRRDVANTLAMPRDHVGIGESAFGDADSWRHAKSGCWLDIAWWPCEWAEKELDAMLVQHRARVGYTTAFWRTIRNGKPVYERTAWHRDLQSRASADYPAALASAIITVNRPWLDGHPFSLRHQLQSALERGDVVSRNHRVAAWIASYFDVVLAANRVLHPGEKRLLEIAERECSKLPTGMREDISELASAEKPLASIHRLLDRLDRFLAIVAD